MRANYLKRMHLFSEIKDALLHLAFPHVCEGCGNDLLEPGQVLCLRCLTSMPATNFHMHSNNPIEKIFWGRLPVTYATAQYYFTKESLMQQLLHRFKYHGNKELGMFLGKLMGLALADSNRFSFLDAVVPLPLFASKERQRGFNQSTILCEGIASVLKIPVWSDVVKRSTFTETQTKKNRIERWQNMESRFELVHPSIIAHKHILLVDDVITTGATVEACGKILLGGENVQLSIASLCFSSHS